MGSVFLFRLASIRALAIPRSTTGIKIDVSVWFIRFKIKRISAMRAVAMPVRRIRRVLLAEVLMVLRMRYARSGP